MNSAQIGVALVTKKKCRKIVHNVDCHVLEIEMMQDCLGPNRIRSKSHSLQLRQTQALQPRRKEGSDHTNTAMEKVLKNSDSQMKHRLLITLIFTIITCVCVYMFTLNWLQEKKPMFIEHLLKMRRLFLSSLPKNWEEERKNERMRETKNEMQNNI